ncbi:hypothetical protein SBI_08473 [Streptomyces bingchenggensis BCW-1]|uniref:Uncharacterized protein n=1 Tax=Streptomyces bingchenggensis (strain BCW-1) TaxID=749414 RepID=D7BSU4_STRBB|nr:hypothetical protein SBI_08473 [Streptomyces bingchenggensis BCW-1]
MKSAARDGDKDGFDGEAAGGTAEDRPDCGVRSARSAFPVEVPMAQTLRPAADSRTHTIDVRGPRTA